MLLLGSPLGRRVSPLSTGELFPTAHVQERRWERACSATLTRLCPRRQRAHPPSSRQERTLVTRIMHRWERLPPRRPLHSALDRQNSRVQRTKESWSDARTVLAAEVSVLRLRRGVGSGAERPAYHVAWWPRPAHAACGEGGLPPARPRPSCQDDVALLDALHVSERRWVSGLSPARPLRAVGVSQPGGRQRSLTKLGRKDRTRWRLALRAGSRAGTVSRHSLEQRSLRHARELDLGRPSLSAISLEISIQPGAPVAPPSPPQNSYSCPQWRSRALVQLTRRLA